MYKSDTVLAGSARLNITPKNTQDMSGYAARQQPMTGVKDEISVRSLFIEHDNRRVLIISVDVLGLDIDQAKQIRHRLADAGFASEEIILGCTHTHSAPAVQQLRGCGIPDKAYVEFLLDSICVCARQAAQERTSCKVYVGESECSLGFNRRGSGAAQKDLVGSDDEGDTQLDATQDGGEDEVDSRLVVLQLRDDDDRPFATVFNYGCHPVVLGHENREISADWPGVVCREIEENGNGFAMYLQGCCGNINPRIRGSEALVDAAGLVSKAVDSALKSAEKIENPVISGFSETVSLPFLPAPDEEWMQARLDEVLAKPKNQWGFAEIRDFDWISDAQAHPDIFAKDCVEVDVGEMRIGDTAIVWIPGEAFGTYSNLIRNAHAPNKVLVAGYTNGNIGYIPTRKAYPEGGYEVDQAYRYYGYRMLAPMVEDILLDTLRATPRT